MRLATAFAALVAVLPPAWAQEQGRSLAPFTVGEAFAQEARRLGFDCMPAGPAQTACHLSPGRVTQEVSEVVGAPVIGGMVTGYDDRLGHLVLVFHPDDFNKVREAASPRFPGLMCARGNAERKCLHQGEGALLFFAAEKGEGVFIVRSAAYKQRKEAETAGTRDGAASAARP